jgi:hypothetical protein
LNTDVREKPVRIHNIWVTEGCVYFTYSQ